MPIKRLIITCSTAAAFLWMQADLFAATYGSVLRKWTHDSRAFAVDSFDSRLIWYATMLSEDMIDAQKALCEKKKVECKLPPTEGGVNFFVSIYAHSYLKDFSLSEDSPWKIYLVGADGVEVPATKIDKVKMTATEAVFYPYCDRWSRAYYVGFPSTDLGTKPKLILRSIVTSSTLKWKIK